MTEENVEEVKVAGPRARLVRVCVAIGVVGLILATSPWWLVGVASILVIDQVSEEPVQGPVWLVLPSGFPKLPEAYNQVASVAERMRAERVVLIPRVPSRVELLGVVPLGVDLSREELQKRGIPSERIETLSEESADFWDDVKIISGLVQNDHVAVVVCVGRFESRAARFVLWRLLKPDVFDKVSVAAIRDPRYDETDWWRSRRGWKSLFLGYASLLHAILLGDPPGWRPMDIEEYENWAWQHLLGKRGGCRPCRDLRWATGYKWGLVWRNG